MPIKHIFTSTGEPVPLCLMPQGIDQPSYPILCRIIVSEVLVCRQQSFEHKGRFYQIGSIVFPAERNGLSGSPVHPMCPDAMIAIGFIEELHYFEQPPAPCLRVMNPRSTPTIIAITPKPEPPMVAIEAVIAALTSKTGLGMGKIPKVTESLFLDKSHQLIIGQSRLFACSGGLQRTSTDHKKK